MKNNKNESKIPYATHYVFDVCFHRSSPLPPPPLSMPCCGMEKVGRGGNCMLRYENHFSALYSHDMQAKGKGWKKVTKVEMKCVAWQRRSLMYYGYVQKNHCRCFHLKRETNVKRLVSDTAINSFFLSFYFNLLWRFSAPAVTTTVAMASTTTTNLAKWNVRGVAVVFFSNKSR